MKGHKTDMKVLGIEERKREGEKRETDRYKIERNGEKDKETSDKKKFFLNISEAQ